ncbi:hypothetical protein GCM10022243_11510 [Saccharothrix violaceirubra]|uniref:Uncharacterized protein n=1 Tax=Saccharothrix violaceirubra TaxID=413306 RepID=A0A7W7T955_9PSEU|nr:AMED_5909 family protein [Saccharothrix violaceirubra]MBB4968651.1 hypothetical protein [Saccharothrix violaceirubra]
MNAAKRWAAAHEARTLTGAHEALGRVMPAPNAEASVWVSFHQAAAKVYDQVAEADQRHHYEARAWAQCERNRLDALMGGSGEVSGDDDE